MRLIRDREVFPAVIDRVSRRDGATPNEIGFRPKTDSEIRIDEGGCECGNQNVVIRAVEINRTNAPRVCI